MLRDLRGLLQSNSFWMGLQFGLSVVLSFVTLKLTLVAYGAQTMGAWFSIAAVFAMVSVIDLGTTVSAVVHIAGAREQGNRDKMGEMFFGHAALLLGAGILLFPTGFLIVRLMYTQPGFQTAITLSSLNFIATALALSGFFQYTAQCCRGFLEGLGDYITFSRILIIGNILTVLLVVIVTVSDMPIEALAVATSAGAASKGVMLWVSFLVRSRKEGVCWALPSRGPIHSLIVAGLPLQLSTLFGTLLDPMIKYFIGRFVSLSDVSYYEIARRFTMSFSGLFTTAFRTILPKSAGLSTPRAMQHFVDESLAKVNRFSVGYYGFAFGICSCGLYILMRYWFSAVEALGIYFIVMAPDIISILFHPYYVALIGARKTAIVAHMQLLNVSVLALSASIGYGLFGSHWALVGCAVSVLAGNLYMTRYYRVSLGIDIAANLSGGISRKAAVLVGVGLTASAAAWAGWHAYAALTVTLLSLVLFQRDIRQSIRIVRKSVSTLT